MHANTHYCDIDRQFNLLFVLENGFMKPFCCSPFPLLQRPHSFVKIIMFCTKLVTDLTFDRGPQLVVSTIFCLVLYIFHDASRTREIATYVMLEGHHNKQHPPENEFEFTYF